MNIAAVKAHARQRGSCFFDPPTMRFFDSRILGHVFTAADQAAYFVTSERFTPSEGSPFPRRYTVCRLDWSSGDIDTIGDFQGFENAEEALAVAKATAEIERHNPH
jgi:hypothetical protein